MWEIIHHPKAIAEADRSACRYNRNRDGLGAEFYDELDAAICRLRENPTLFPPDRDGVHSWRLNRFPFRVYYMLDLRRIRILAVAHLSRRPGYWRHRIGD